MQIGFPLTGHNEIREIFKERFLDANFLTAGRLKQMVGISM